MSDLNKKFDGKEIPLIFQKCLRQKFDILSDELKIYIQDYYKIHQNSFNLTLMRTLNKKIFLNEDDQKKLKFVNEINSFNDNLINQLKKINFEIKFAPETNFQYVELLTKNFNVYVISSILSLMVSLVLFYFLFILRNYLKFLNKIF